MPLDAVEAALALQLRVGAGEPLRVLCLGAHCDDIEIGCGATLLRLAADRPLDVTWVVLASTPARSAELRRSAALFLARASKRRVIAKGFRDGFLPEQWGRAKRAFESLKRTTSPHLVFTHFGGDRHQDHRIVSELTWNTFRRHLILEYEVPKYDADLATPNVYVPVNPRTMRQKARYLLEAYTSQRDKSWFTADTFGALMRIRGIESGSREGYAEGFHGRKITI